ncbi:MAG: multidrug ABC transporter ATP-binding protein [Desulfobacterales bacterium]|nr:MAG: multidrug ABC transporter ATP-binding protein [Desulfobacterales bacterium]
MTEQAIQWCGVSFSIPEGFWMKRKRILKDIDLSVPAGTVLGLVGPNGAGKTTTIKLGAGLIAPESGEVTIFGKPVKDAPARRPVGLLTESQYIYPHLKLKEWLMMLAGFSGLDAAASRKRIGEVLELMDLSGREKQMMRTFSKGQLQRAGFAQAIIHDPPLLFLDEPMSGLDPFWRYRFQGILQDMKAAGKTLIFSSHIIYDVEQLSDQIALIQGGRLQWSGRLSDLSREVKGYEAVCATDRSDILENLVSAEKMIRSSDGDWIINLTVEQKDELLSLAADKSVALISLRPIRQEIEEVLFGFEQQHKDSL